MVFIATIASGEISTIGILEEDNILILSSLLKLFKSCPVCMVSESLEAPGEYSNWFFKNLFLLIRVLFAASELDFTGFNGVDVNNRG